MDISMKRAIVICLLTLGSNAAKATDNTARQGVIIREPWTADGLDRGGRPLTGVRHRLALRQPAARASDSLQNQRSPYCGLILVSQ